MTETCLHCGERLTTWLLGEPDYCSLKCWRQYQRRGTKRLIAQMD